MTRIQFNLMWSLMRPLLSIRITPLIVCARRVSVKNEEKKPMDISISCLLCARTTWENTTLITFFHERETNEVAAAPLKKWYFILSGVLFNTDTRLPFQDMAVRTAAPNQRPSQRHLPFLVVCVTCLIFSLFLSSSSETALCCLFSLYICFVTFSLTISILHSCDCLFVLFLEKKVYFFITYVY